MVLVRSVRPARGRTLGFFSEYFVDVATILGSVAIAIYVFM